MVAIYFRASFKLNVIKFGYLSNRYENFLNRNR